MTDISFIIPAYNASGTIVRTLDSIGFAVEGKASYEVILVDDGSRDDSVRIAVDYEISDPRVRSVTKENGGVSSARNMGLDKASGEWIAFVMHKTLNHIEQRIGVLCFVVRKFQRYFHENGIRGALHVLYQYRPMALLIIVVLIVGVSHI